MRIPNLITGRTANLPGDWKHSREPTGERQRAADHVHLSVEQPSDHPRAARQFTIRIPDWMPTPLNRLMGQHWAKAGRQKKHDTQVLAAHQDAVPAATGKRSVEVLVVLPKGRRAPDPDALWKSLLDGCVHCGLLVNDSRHWVVTPPVQFARGEKLATFLTFTDL